MEETLDFLINYFINENPNMKIDVNKIPNNLEEKKKAYRAICNMRQARPLDEEILKKDDWYLQELLKEKELTNWEDIKTIDKKYKKLNLRLKNIDKIAIWKGDITTLKIDAIVNAGNSNGQGCFMPLHSCIDNIIHSNSGIRLRLACFEEMKKINYRLQPGRCILTPGFNLPAKYVITTVGPQMIGYVNKKMEDQLADCYKYSMFLALKNGIRTIAFPCISTGVYRFPNDLAAKIATEAVDEVLNQNGDKFDKIIFDVYSDQDLKYYERYISE